MPEISFIEEVPQTLLHYSLYQQKAKIDLIRLTPYRWHFTFRATVTSEKDDFAKFLAEYRISRAYSAKNFVNWRFLITVVESSTLIGSRPRT